MSEKSGGDPGELYVSGGGRIGRRVFVPALALVILAFELYQRLGSLVHWITGWAVYPVLICAAASVLSKRLHDRGRSGWWAALVLLALALVWPEFRGGWAVLATPVMIWAVVELGLMAGEQGANRFGPPPLAG